MKKKRLLRTATFIALLVGGVLCTPFEAKAQTLTDVTSTYLTNADLSDGSGTGWTKTGNWADNSGTASGTVYVSENYAGWGALDQTDFALKQTVTLPAGLYKIDAYALYRGTVGNVLLSAASASTTLGSVVVATAGAMSPTGSNDLQKAANSFNPDYAYLNTVYFYLSASTAVTIGYTGVHTEKQQWFVAGPMKLYKYADDSTISSCATLDFTSLIFNPSFESGNTNGWTTTASSDTGARSTTNDNYKMSGSQGNYLFNTWWKGTPCTQALANLPAGQYELASVVASDGATIYLINGEDTNDYAYTETTDKEIGITLKKDFLLASDASNYKIGVVGGANGTAGEHKTYQADGYWWYKCDNFTLTYKGNGVEHYATSQNGNAAADTWYAQDITVAGSYILTTNGSATIVYTQNPALEPGKVTTTASNGDELTLAVGTIYYKASAGTPLTIAAASFTYEIGAATVDYAYVQGGETVRVTYANTITNDPNASFAKNGNPAITFGDNAVTVTPTSNGFTFIVPTVMEGKSYTLSIPADAFGYATGSTYNSAQQITIKTPAIFDQTAFLQDNETGLFLARGQDWGTRAYLDIYGTATQITTDAEGYTTFKFVDTDRYLYYDGSNNLYCDRWAGGNETKWVVTLADGKYRLTGKDKTAGTDYVKYDASDSNRLLWANIAGKSGENIVGWNLVNASDYASAMTALKNTQASTAATAAGLDAATPDALATAVNGWASGKVIAGKTVTGTAEKFKQGQTNPAPITIVSGEVYISTPGLYKFTMQAFYRMRDNATNYTLHTQGWDQPAAYVYFGNAKTQVASVFDASNTTSDGCYTGADNNYYPNGQSAAKNAFQAGNYVNTVWKYVTQAEIDAATNGKFEYGLKYQGWPNWAEWDNGSQKVKVDQWSCWAIESVELTLYAENNADYVKDGVRHYIGTYDSAPDITLTDDIPVANTTAANFSSSTSSVNFTNPNGLVFAKSDQISADHNVIVNGNCANLVLTSGGSFVNPTEFTATSAKYTVAAADLAGGNFATLMLPFNASLPSNGQAYKLDQGVNVLDGNVRGTSVSSITANEPVLIKTAGDYTGSNVTVPAIASGAKYVNGELVGTYSAVAAPTSSYVLQNHTSGEGVAFYLVGSTQPTVNPFRAYIKPQASNVKAISVMFDEDGIQTMDNGQWTMDNAEIFNLSGQRLSKPQRGVNIINGKKVVVK